MPSLPTFPVRPFETPCRIDQQQQQHERHDANLMCTIFLEFKFMESRPTAPQWLMSHSVGSADFLCHVRNFFKVDLRRGKPSIRQCWIS